MLTITDHTLIIDVQYIALPHLTKPATVRVWRVPTEYRASGLNVLEKIAERDTTLTKERAE